MDLTGMSPFRNAQYTPSVPVPHAMYGQMAGAHNMYADDVSQVRLLLTVSILRSYKQTALPVIPAHSCVKLVGWSGQQSGADILPGL